MAHATRTGSEIVQLARREFLTCSLLLPLFAAGQDEPVVAETVDEFTSVRAVRVEPRSCSNGPCFAWVGGTHGRKLHLRWSQPGWVNAVVLEGDTLMLKLESGCVLVLESDRTVIGLHDLNKLGEPVTISDLYYGIRPDQVHEIVQFWVVKLRVHFREGRQEKSFLVDPKWQYELSRSARTFAEALSKDPDLPKAVDEESVERVPVQLHSQP